MDDSIGLAGGLVVMGLAVGADFVGDSVELSVRLALVGPEEGAVTHDFENPHFLKSVPDF